VSDEARLRGHFDVIDRRMEALFVAITSRRWEHVEFSYDQVLRAVSKARAVLAAQLEPASLVSYDAKQRQVTARGLADLPPLESEPAASLDREALDAAWNEAEAALPDGGRLHLQRRAEAEAVLMDDGQTWIARQGRAPGAYEAWATDRTKALGFAYDATPTAALRKLAAHLREPAAMSNQPREERSTRNSMADAMKEGTK
jgi:hypothetical protein